MEYSFIIRKAEISDAASIKKIMKPSFEKYISEARIDSKVEALTESVSQIEDDIKNKYVYLAMVDGVPAGSLRITVNEDGTAYLTRFGVVPDYNNMGIGKSLLALADKLMKTLNIEKLILYAAANHSELIQFYYKRGFCVESVDRERGYIRARLVKEYNYRKM